MVKKSRLVFQRVRFKVSPLVQHPATFVILVVTGYFKVVVFKYLN